MRSASTAVLLNTNAKRVTHRVKREVTRLLPESHIFVSHSMEEGGALAEEIVRSGFRNVVTGGGDGTIVNVIDGLIQARRRTNGDAGLDWVLPRVAPLMLGTGNAIANHLCCGPIRRDLLLLQQAMSLSTYRTPVLEHKGHAFPFAGFGWDASINNHFYEMNRKYASRWFRPVVRSVLGYIIAAFGKTVPDYVFRHLQYEMEVTNLDRAYRLDSRGCQVGGPIAPGEVLYSGPVGMATMGIITTYGWGMKLLPFATDRPGYFQFRACCSSIAEIIANLPTIWRGDFHSPNVFDFHVRRIRLRFDKPMPWHVGGEAMGYEDDLEIGMTPESVSFVRYPAWN